MYVKETTECSDIVSLISLNTVQIIDVLFDKIFSVTFWGPNI